ncbi:MAG: NAD(P)H-dependent oxidoreductase [Flavobacteriales bacterium]|nr:NAD(P)H-dependent oxidoreductase [Flavobacteriales bacterium]
MITLICGTNRPNNQSQKFINTYKELLNERNVDCEELYLEHLPHDLAFANDIIGTAAIELKNEIEKKIIPAKKLVVVVPEYNGSLPGILKSFIDCIEPKYFREKLVALVGVSAGRSGNLRGMDHLTGIFNYLGAEVLATKVDIANLNTILDKNGAPTNEEVIRRMNLQIDHLLK